MACDVDILAGRKPGMLTIGVTNDMALRAWKTHLIERGNPIWDDLDEGLNG